MSSAVTALHEFPFLNRARALAPELVRIRRDLHSHPELAFQETRTARLIVDELKLLGISQIRTGLAETGVIADLGGPHGPTVALRADMDALPIQDAKTVPYASTHAGVTHACGHDAHVAMVIGAAFLLREYFARHSPAGRVRFLFQPSEEHHDAQGISGAAKMVTAGALEGVEAIVGLHVDSSRPTGQITVRPGPFTAAEDTFSAWITAAGGHGAYPHTTRDPIWMLIPVLSALHGIVPRRIDPLEPAVLTVGQVHAGTASNVIPSELFIEGTLRSFSGTVRETLLAEVEQALGLARLLGGDFRLAINRGYPTTRNDPAMVELLRQAARPIEGLGPENDAPIGLGSEDFAYYCEKIPGVLSLIGAATTDGVSRPHHTPIFDIDEGVLPLGAALMARSAALFLARPAS